MFGDPGVGNVGRLPDEAQVSKSCNRDRYLDAAPSGFFGSFNKAEIQGRKVAHAPQDAAGDVEACLGSDQG